jgi:hypothetical protein
VTFSFQQTLTATMAYAKEFSYSEKAVAEIGIPFLNKASVDVCEHTQRLLQASSRQTSGFDGFKIVTYNLALCSGMPAGCFH